MMRTNLLLDGADSDSAWKSMGIIEKPNRRSWQEMAGSWKARVEWVDDGSLESEDDAIINLNGNYAPEKADPTLPHQRADKPQVGSKKDKRTQVEKMVVGWGDTAWVVHVHPGGPGVGKDVGERSVGRVDLVHR
jgi:hypothetical protein